MINLEKKLEPRLDWGKWDYKPNTVPYINWYQLQLFEKHKKIIHIPAKVTLENLPGEYILPQF